MTYCYFGHHKCASAWFCGVIPAVCQDLGLSWHTTSSFADFDFGSPAGRADFLLFRNAGMNHVPRARDCRGFHVIRDPRDVVVSAYHSHRNSHPATAEWRELNEIRERPNGMSFEAGLLWFEGRALRFVGDRFDIRAAPGEVHLTREVIAGTFLGLLGRKGLVLTLPQADGPIRARVSPLLTVLPRTELEWIERISAELAEWQAN